MDMDNAELEDEVRTIIMELMIVLYKHGITEVHMGGLLRLLGVEEDKARESDDERVVLDEKFTKYIKDQVVDTPVEKKPRTLH
jgi:hypothetical protein